MAKPKDCHSLTFDYIELFRGRYGKEPTVNRYAARWGFDSVLSGMSVAEAKELLKYYFSTANAKGHSIEWFFYNYEKLQVSKALKEDDDAKRAELRQASEERARRWRESGKQGISNDFGGTEE